MNQLQPQLTPSEQPHVVLPEAVQAQMPPEQPYEPTKGDHLARLTGATATSMLGVGLAAEAPTTAGKLVGGAMALYGARDYVNASAEMSGREMPTESLMGRTKQRLFEMSQVLADKHADSQGLIGRLKRRVGEEVLDLQDKEFRVNFQRLVGGMAVSMFGIQLMEVPGTAAKVVSGALMVGGMAETVLSTQKVGDRTNQLAAQGGPSRRNQS